MGGSSGTARASAAQDGWAHVSGRDVTGQLAQVTTGRGQLGDRTELVDLVLDDLGLVRDERARGHVEARARGEHVELDAGGQDRRVALGLVGIGDHVGAVEDRDRAAADHLQHRAAHLVPDHGSGVLVDADAEELRALGHDHQQPTVAVALLEVLVDHAPGEQAEPGGDLGHPLLRRRTTGAEGDHVRGLDRGPGRGAADGGAAAVGGQDRVAERGAGDHGRELELVAAGHEDAGRVTEPFRERRIVGLLPGLGPGAEHLAGAELREDGVVHLDHLGPERARRRDHRDPGVGATGALHEPGQDLATPQLVLGSADHEERSWSVARTVAGRLRRRHDRHTIGMPE